MVHFTISASFNVSKKELFNAWLHSKKHAGMTGANAKVSASAKGSFSAWDGYITGKNLELHPYEKIVQLWRTTEFNAGDEDSLLEIHLEENDASTMLTITHTNLPPDGLKYKQGWIDFYFIPMHEYFSAPR